MQAGINQYAYVNGNPINYNDPFGLTPRPPGYWDMTADASTYVSNIVSDVRQSLGNFTKGVTNDERSGLAGWLPKGAPVVTVGDAIGSISAYAYAKATGNDAMVDAATEGMAANKQNNIDTLFLLGTMGKGSSKAGVPTGNFTPSSNVTKPYVRPSGAGPTAAQRAVVQGQPCVDCGAITGKQVADHIDPLVVEYYRTGAVNTASQRSINAVQPHCPECSASQGGQLSAFAKRMKSLLGF